ncbi:hypothetical protein F5B17DRAFT_421070 [Nemania serpens]|nr:hypothetical protein F5B17DRAFT_421070 [Nemania serpens]
MARRRLGIIPPPGPEWKGWQHVEPYLSSVLIDYTHHGVTFRVFVSCVEEELPTGYDIEGSIEGKILLKIDELCYGETSEQKDEEISQLQDHLIKLVGVACFTLMQELAPATPPPEARTLQEYLYPVTYTLQVLTEDKNLASHRLRDYSPPDPYPPISEDKLRAMDLDEDIPVFNPSQVVLGERLQGLVWKVEVDGELMLCKASCRNAFWNSLSGELATYQKIRRAKDELLVPELKGLVKSHTGIVGILLNYIPKKHFNLSVLLRDVEDGTVPEAAASPTLKKKWAGQIKHTISQLHDLGIVWGDVKTDNVLIDDNDDAFVIDFGGGNTMGWVDQDKHGTVEGDMQGLDKILKLLGAE